MPHANNFNESALGPQWIDARTRVIAADDEMIRAEIAANDGML
jgi:hypothetical protein